MIYNVYSLIKGYRILESLGALDLLEPSKNSQAGDAPPRPTWRTDNLCQQQPCLGRFFVGP